MAEKSVTNMVYAKRHNGFSLIEVLFAVMVLTMGLIFTASQFPIGLMTSRQVTETTLHAVESRNAEVMTRLQMGLMNNSFYGAGPTYFINYDSNVHYWCQPNIRVGDVAIVMDDPTNVAYPYDPHPDPDVYEINNTTSVPYRIPSHISEYKFDSPPDKDLALAPENIGRIVLPQINGYDREVVDIMGAANTPFDTNVTEYHNWQETILGVALERSYSQAVFYKPSGWHCYQIWVFTLSNTNKDTIYALQDKDSFEDIDPQPFGPDGDRRFPVPWKVQFDEPAPQGEDRIKLIYVAKDDRDIEAALLAIFRKDSYIIDADNGLLYKIKDIELAEDTGTGLMENWVRLDRALIENMEFFWIFPPAIIRGEGFAETQPVVNVTETTISF